MTEYDNIRKSLIAALKDVEINCDESVIRNMINEHPDVVIRLVGVTDKEGKPLFTPAEVDEILYQCRDLITYNPGRTLAVLNNPQEIGVILGYKCRGAGLMRCIQDPLDSTVEQNLKTFGLKRTKLSELLAYASTEIEVEHYLSHVYSHLSDYSREMKKREEMATRKARHEEYFKEVETRFVKGKTSKDWTEYGVREYNKLKEEGIIDKEGNIIDIKGLLKSDLIQEENNSLRPACCGTVRYAEALIIQKIQYNPSIAKLSRMMKRIENDEKSFAPIRKFRDY